MQTKLKKKPEFLGRGDQKMGRTGGGNQEKVTFGGRHANVCGTG